jgi:hypothetical protein
MANQKKPATPSKPAEAKPAENARPTRTPGKGSEPKAARAEAEESKAPEKAEAPKDKAARQLALPEAPATPAPPAVAPAKAEEKPAEKAPAKAGKKGREPAAAPDPAEALERFRAEAAALPGEPEPCNNVDLDAVRANVAEALAALEPHLDAAAAALPRVNPAALRDLPALVQALELAILQANPPEASKGEILARLRKVRPGRALALRQLEILSDEQVGLIPAAKVQRIRQGTGPVDTAKDAVAIRALFQEYYLTVYNKHPLSQTFLDELAQDGEWLLAQMRPKNAPRSEEEDLSPAMRVRDQLWTLLQKRYDDAYLVAVEVWGRRAAEGHVPPLLSRRAAPTSPASPQG